MPKKMTFESAIKRLEEITDILEGGQETLDKSLKLYEEGASLAAFCSKSLEDARLRITEISKDNNKVEKENDETKNG